MSHVHKLIRFSNGEALLGEVLEKSMHFSQPDIQMRNVFKLVQFVEPEAYQMTTIVRYMHFISDEYIFFNKDHITFMSNIEEDVIKYMNEFDDEELTDEGDIEDKLLFTPTANNLGIVH